MSASRASQFDPTKIAGDMKKTGAFVPGIRPGRPTATFLDKTMNRITLAGALFLALIAIIPTLIMFSVHNMTYNIASFFGGTALLIIVGVMLDTVRSIESHLLMRQYDGFMGKGKIHGRRAY